MFLHLCVILFTGGSLSGGGFSVWWGSLSGRGFLSRGSLSREVSVWRGLCPGGVSVQRCILKQFLFSMGLEEFSVP